MSATCETFGKVHLPEADSISGSLAVAGSYGEGKNQIFETWYGVIEKFHVKPSAMAVGPVIYLSDRSKVKVEVTWLHASADLSNALLETTLTDDLVMVKRALHKDVYLYGSLQGQTELISIEGRQQEA